MVLKNKQELGGKGLKKLEGEGGLRSTPTHEKQKELNIIQLYNRRLISPLKHISKKNNR